VIRDTFDKVNAGGSIPPCIVDEETPSDLLKFGNNAANDGYTKRCKEAGMTIHPARFPAALPEFFMKLTTDEGDVVLDPFGGSMTTGFVAESLGRRWIGSDNVEEYVEGAKLRFSEAAVR
jgi:site-specific DNA-methyltransferase (cytosine-N4-specific)